MKRILRPLALFLCTFVLAGCFRGPATERSAGDGPRKDAGSDEQRDAGPGDDFPYRWKENGPEDGAALGLSSFRLTCIETESGRERDDCAFTCSHEALDESVPRYACGPAAEPEPCAGEFVPRDLPGRNRVCVTTLKPPTDERDYGDIAHTACWEWNAAAFAYRVATPDIDPRYTAVVAGLSCERKTVSSDGTPVPRCAFECSLDRRPYEPCDDGFIRQVAPGSHELRVRVGAYLGKLLRMSPDEPSAFTFRIADDATPPLLLPTLPEPSLERDLEPYEPLMQDYTEYAQACAGVEAADAALAMFRYLDTALARGADVDAELVQGCREVLAAVVASDDHERACRAAMGIGADLPLREELLPVRLPEDCLMLSFFGVELGDGYCFTHAECDLGRLCVPLSSTGPVGRCDVNLPRGTATYCGTVACDEDDYCKSGVCTPRRPEGGECFEDHECWRGASCQGRRCVRLRCEGQTCTTEAQCQSGVCQDGACAAGDAG